MSPRPVTLVALVCLLWSVAWPQSQAGGGRALKRQFLSSKPAPPRAGDLRAEPHHRLLFENEHMRAYRLELPPGGATARHPHAHASLLIALEESDLVLSGGVRSQRATLAPGQMQVLVGGGGREERNASQAPLRALAVELLHGLGEEEVLCGLDRGACPTVGQSDLRRGGYSVSTLFETRRVRVTETILDPGAGFYPSPQAAEYLVVPLTESRLREQVDRWIPTVHRLQPGLVEWEAAAERALTNLGEQPARFLTIACKNDPRVAADAR